MKTGLGRNIHLGHPWAGFLENDDVSCLQEGELGVAGAWVYGKFLCFSFAYCRERLKRERVRKKRVWGGLRSNNFSARNLSQEITGQEHKDVC